MTHRVALIGGSAEARDIARRLGTSVVWIGLPAPERVATTWPRQPLPLPETADALAAALRASDATALIDASHPCDSATANLAVRAAQDVALPRIRLLRPPWRATRRDSWIPLRDAGQAAQILPPGARVFTATGRGGLNDLRALRQQVVFCRQLEHHTAAFPLRHGRFLFDSAPFSPAGEIRLLRRLRIDALLVHNAGGPGGWPKLAAARALGLPVLMVARPAPPPGPIAASVDDALLWLDRR